MLAFKSISAQWINDFRKTPGLPIWQQNYHRRVVDSHAEVDRVREAIENQPLTWRMDVEQSFGILPIEADNRNDSRETEDILRGGTRTPGLNRFFPHFSTNTGRSACTMIWCARSSNK